MASCLGLYIENNIIKYAKLSKEQDKIKIDSCGIKIYDNLNQTIDEIISETISFNIPISINLSEETYNYFNMFNLLNKKDLEKAVKTEFESICYDKGYNSNALETRYACVDNRENSQQVKVIHVSVNKAGLLKKLQLFEGKKVTTISPLSVTIANLIDVKEKENVAIINIENKTKITFIINQKIYDVKTIENGMEEILQQINIKENSFKKAYDICKNTTIYTSQGKELQDTESSYLEDIMPTLYNIVIQAKEIIKESFDRIDKIYITGIVAVINNIDLYFQENLSDLNCEILKPYFLNNLLVKVNMKDYIEANSAISLAMQGLGEGIKSMNFKKSKFTDKLRIPSKGNGTSKEGKKSIGNIMHNVSFSWDLNQKMTHTERALLRVAAFIFTIILVFSIGSKVVQNQINEKKLETQTVIEDTNSQIKSVSTDIEKVNARTSKYSSMKQNLENISLEISEKYANQDAIPNLLYNIMYAIPEQVQVTSIQNSTNKHIVIEAQSYKYEQIGYFKAKLKTDGILLNVVSNSSTKQDGMVKVTIEGDLP